MEQPIYTLSDRKQRSLIARRYYSGFEQAHDTYNAISAASDGKIYYVLSSASIDRGGQVYVYDPFRDETLFLAGLNTVCGEGEGNAIPQGKSHVEFFERKGKLYFATHVGWYEMRDGIERLPQHPPPGYAPYPGGHILSYDLSNGRFEDLALAPAGEGIVTMTMDRERGHIYALTWPHGCLLHYDVVRRQLKNLGPVSGEGEAGQPGSTYRVLCRSLVVDPRDGKMYGSTAEGAIFGYSPYSGKIEPMEDISLRLDYFGSYDPSLPGSMGYNWRKILWYPPEGVAYGVHGNSGYLFRFDPWKRTVELVERLTSEPSRRSGMFDLFTYGYLGLQLGPDGHTLYYLTGGPVYEHGKRLRGDDCILVGSKGVENLHLVTYHLVHKTYTDHGPVFYEDGSRPSYVNSLALGADGTLYTLARFEQGGREIQDLVRIPNPLIGHRFE